MRRSTPLAAVVALIAVVVLTATGCAVHAQKLSDELKIASIFSTEHPATKAGVAEFVAALDKGPGAPIRSEYWPSGQLGDSADLTAFARDGLVDVAGVVPPYQADMFPLAGVSDLPGFDPDTCVTSLALMRLLEPGGIVYEKEFKPLGLVPLWVGTVTQYEIWTATKEVRTPEDLHGLSIRSSGGVMDSAIRQLGASPVAIPGTDLFEALQRHTIDGAAFPTSSVKSYGLQAVIRHATRGIGVGSGSWIFSMSERTWNTLDPEQQQHVRAAAKSAGRKQCEGIRAAEKASEEVLKNSKVAFTDLSQPERQAFNQKLPEIQNSWAHSLNEIGKPGSQTLEAYRRAVEAQQKEEGKQ